MKGKQNKSPKRTAIYIRVSSDKQSASGLGLESQSDRCRAYCEMAGLESVEVFRDDISTGVPLGKRPAGKRMLELIDNGEINTIVTLKLDRVFRSVLETLQSVKKWKEQGVAFHIVDFEGLAMDTSSAMGKTFLIMTAAFAELERNLISERTKAAMAVAKKNGQRVGSIPFGYIKVEGTKKLAACNEEQAIIGQMLILKNNGLTIRDLAEELNQCGLFNRGKLWSKSAVQRVLKGTRVRGRQMVK
jgi:DNA invertase Pin-like site-specific DNA recombinase